MVDTRMLHKAFGGLVTIGSGAAVAFLAGALQGGSSPATTSGLWIAVVSSVIAAMAGAMGWVLTRESNHDTQPTIGAQTGDHSNALVGGRDIKAGRDITLVAGDYHEAPAPVSHTDRASPSFAITDQPSPDGFVHLLLSNLTDPAEFHVDVTGVQGTISHETTPYGVKWRGYTGEDRRIVKDALIDLAEVVCPSRTHDDRSFIILNPHRRKNGQWESGYFRLFSFNLQEGWVVEPEAGRPPTGCPDELGFFFEQIVLHIRVTRIDTGEEIRRSVTVGFGTPKWNDTEQRWDTPKPDVRVITQDSSAEPRQRTEPTGRTKAEDKWSPEPRCFAAADAAQMIRKLHGYGQVDVDIYWLHRDLEAQQFATEIERLLKAAGWNVHMMGEAGGGMELPGLWIGNENGTQYAPALRSLADNLRDLGFAVNEGEAHWSARPSEIYVNVSER